MKILKKYNTFLENVDSSNTDIDYILDNQEFAEYSKFTRDELLDMIISELEDHADNIAALLDEKRIKGYENKES